MTLTIVEECKQFDGDDYVEGHFLLSDGTKIMFNIGDVSGSLEWFQWGASTEKLGITVDRVEEIKQELLETF